MRHWEEAVLALALMAFFVVGKLLVIDLRDCRACGRSYWLSCEACDLRSIL